MSSADLTSAAGVPTPPDAAHFKVSEETKKAIIYDDFWSVPDLRPEVPDNEKVHELFKIALHLVKNEQKLVISTKELLTMSEEERKKRQWNPKLSPNAGFEYPEVFYVAVMCIIFDWEGSVQVLDHIIFRELVNPTVVKVRVPIPDRQPPFKPQGRPHAYILELPPRLFTPYGKYMSFPDKELDEIYREQERTAKDMMTVTLSELYTPNKKIRQLLDGKYAGFPAQKKWLRDTIDKAKKTGAKTWVEQKLQEFPEKDRERIRKILGNDVGVFWDSVRMDAKRVRREEARRKEIEAAVKEAERKRLEEIQRKKIEAALEDANAARDLGVKMFQTMKNYGKTSDMRYSLKRNFSETEIGLVALGCVRFSKISNEFARKQVFGGDPVEMLDWMIYNQNVDPTKQMVEVITDSTPPKLENVPLQTLATETEDQRVQDLLLGRYAESPFQKILVKTISNYIDQKQKIPSLEPFYKSAYISAVDYYQLKGSANDAKDTSGGGPKFT